MAPLAAIFVIGCVALVGFAVWFLNRPDSELESLRKEKISKYLPNGATLSNHFEGGRPRINIFGGRSSPANLTQRFSSCPTFCYGELLLKAQNDGWLNFPGAKNQPDSALLYKSRGSRHLTLSIVAHDANNPADASIIVTYEHGPLIPFGGP